MPLLGEWTIIYLLYVVIGITVATVGYKVGSKLKQNKLTKEAQESEALIE